MIQLSSLSSLPLYRQIVEQVKQMAAAGTLRPGDRLPSVRGLAGELKVNTLTVSKAYARLKAEGIVRSRPSKGIFIAGGSSPLTFGSRRKRLGLAADEFVAECYRLGIDAAEAIDLLRERFAARQALANTSPPGRGGDGDSRPGQAGERGHRFAAGDSPGGDEDVSVL